MPYCRLSYIFSGNCEYFSKVSFLATQIRRYWNTYACSSWSSIVFNKYDIVCVKTWNHCLLPLPQTNKVATFLLAHNCNQHLQYRLIQNSLGHPFYAVKNLSYDVLLPVFLELHILGAMPTIITAMLHG